jgi:hypothetical protein
MVEWKLKGICYNCDDKFFPGHKCKEHKLFMAILEDVSDEYVEVSPEAYLLQMDDIMLPSNPPKVEPLISMNSLTYFSTPQTLKLIGCIKHRKVIILVDSGNTHNFIHHFLSQEIFSYICVFNNFKIVISNGGSMKCGGRCENVCLQIGQYNLKCHMFSIDMGGFEIVLGVELLLTLGLVTIYFKDLTMQFQQEGQHYKFQGITIGSPEITSSHPMERLLKKGHFVIISQLHSIQAVETPSVHLELQDPFSPSHNFPKSPGPSPLP